MTNFQPLRHVLPRRQRQTWRWILPVLLAVLFLSIMMWLPFQMQRMEQSERQEQLIADTLWVEQTIRFQMARDEQNIRLIADDIVAGHGDAKHLMDKFWTLLRNNPELARIIWLDVRGGKHTLSTDDRVDALDDLTPDSIATEQRSRKSHIPLYAPPTKPANAGVPLIDYHLPLYRDDTYIGTLIATFSTASIMEDMVPWWFAQDNEIELVDSDDSVVYGRAVSGRGRGVYTHFRALDLPGLSLALRTNSVKGKPRLLPGVLGAAVLALSVGLLWSLWALWRDNIRRLKAEDALHEQVLFRTAMENSLVTGLRARDLEGRITYVNPAFCQMLGLPAEDILGKKPPMSYWAPEAMEEFQQRFTQMLAGSVRPQGYETVFLRANGDRFPVLIFESPLVDDSGKQTGWMGSILDISEIKRIEDLNRQQEEKLQASARLAVMGELASMLAHELNQPLAAISSYTTGAINLLDSDQNEHVAPGLLRAALDKARTQAQRAGQIIRSVHTFVKKHEPLRERITIGELVDSVMPLVEMQADRFFVSIHTRIAPKLPPLFADRVLLEQVLLNLTRNAIESMQYAAPEKRILRIIAELEPETSPPTIAISVIDQGHGIAPDVAEKLFSRFFTTKTEGMGMGLSICRTAIEFHGGTLRHSDNPRGGTIFRFTLPVMEEVVSAANA
jgi:two-component system sensor histidine kinase DctS